MKKLALDLDQLCVESFSTSRGESVGRGTVRALSFEEFNLTKIDVTVRETDIDCTLNGPGCYRVTFFRSCNGTCYCD